MGSGQRRSSLPLHSVVPCSKNRFAPHFPRPDQGLPISNPSRRRGSLAPPKNSPKRTASREPDVAVGGHRGERPATRVPLPAQDDSASAREWNRFLCVPARSGALPGACRRDIRRYRMPMRRDRRQGRPWTRGSPGPQAMRPGWLSAPRSGPAPSTGSKLTLPSIQQFRR